MVNKVVIFFLYTILLIITIVMVSYYVWAITFLSLIIILIYYFIKNREDLIHFSNHKDSGELSFAIKHKWYESQIILLPALLCINLIIIYIKSPQHLNSILPLQIFSNMVFVISFSLLDHFQRRKKGLYKIIISDKELVFLEEITWKFNIQKLKRVILTGNEKQLWVESKWLKYSFNLNKLKETDKSRFIVSVKSIAIKNGTLINNILEQYT